MKAELVMGKTMNEHMRDNIYRFKLRTIGISPKYFEAYFCVLKNYSFYWIMYRIFLGGKL